MKFNMKPNNAVVFGEPPHTWEEIAHALFTLLDAVDTASDIAKGDESLYRHLVHEAHKQRFDYCYTDGYDVHFNVKESS